MKNLLIALCLANGIPHKAAAEEVDHYPAYLSGGTLLQFCSADKSDPNQNAKIQACYAFVMGVNDALVDVYTGRGERMPYCMPVLQTPGELVATIKPLLNARRSEKTRAAALVREHLTQAFPCSPN